MQRRQFLKLLGMAGLTYAAVPGVTGRVFAQSRTYDGPLYLIIHCGGGWDPTSFCDPKGTLDTSDPNRLNNYSRDAIESPSMGSPIRWAPMGTNRAFFERHYSKLLVLNGIDTSTNNHGTGPRHIHSGTLTEGHPAFAALVAAIHAGDKPMGFITNGGYDTTRGITARTRVGNINAIRAVAEPNAYSADVGFHLPVTMDRILEAQRERLEAQRDRQQLASLQIKMGEMALSRSSNNELRRLTELLPDLNAFDTSLGQQAAMAMAAFRADLCVSANLSTGGFDTHSNHDQNQSNALTRLTDGLNEIWQSAEAQGIADRLVVLVGSDFGRTPRYNDGNGKDHWPITSMLIMGAGIRGNRVVGTSDATHRPVPLNPTTLAPDPGGIILRPVHIQRDLRRMAGIEGSEWEAQYPLPGDDLSILA